MKSAFFASHLITLRFGFEVLIKGAIHSSKISGLTEVRKFLGGQMDPEGSGRSRLIPFSKKVSHSFMADAYHCCSC